MSHTDHSEVGVFHYEPICSARFLPGCPTCGDRHPLAYRPPVQSETCLTCGAPVPEPGEAEDIPAVITGKTPSGLAAKALLGAGKWLASIAKGL